MLTPVALLILVAAQAGPAPQALAADPGRLERLRREADAMAARNRDLQATASRLTAELESLSLARDVAAAEAAAAAARLDRVTAAVAEWSSRAEAAGLREAAARAGLAARLRRLDRMGPAAAPAALALAGSPEEAVGALRGLTDAAALDRAALRETAAAREGAALAAAELAASRAELEAALERADAARRAHEAAIDSYQARLAEVRRQEALYERAVAELSQAADELESFLAGRAATPPPGPDPAALRGTWRWPARGGVLQEFGPRRHPRFGTRVPHNGLAIGAPAGADVRAVADGRVVYADWFQGYGRTVILDHGAGVMTVYSHLSAVIVAPGDVIDSGGLLGLVGDSGSLAGPRLYFEVRRSGEPEDPRAWLADAP